METRHAALSRVSSALMILGVIAVAAVAYLTYSSGPSAPSSNISTSSLQSAPLIMFNADAYTAEAQKLLDGFSASTGVPAAPPHSGGSFALARQIASGSQVDVFVPVALSAAAPSNLGNLSAGWAIGFASDQMVLAYPNASIGASAAEVVQRYRQASLANSTSDWDAFFSSLVSGNVKVGISDPNADPAGLRGWLVLEAAGSLYGGNQDVYVTRLLQARANVTGSAAANMVAPLQTGQFQFLFIYRSVAIAQHLEYFQLDRRINLGDPTLTGYYSRFSYKLRAGNSQGAPIILCVTIPRNVPHLSEATKFVQYLVKNAGVVAPFGLDVFSPPLLYNDTAPPQPIVQLLSQGSIASAGGLGR